MHLSFAQGSVKRWRAGLLLLWLAVGFAPMGRCALVYTNPASPPNSSLALWYQTPAARFLSALPLGNGRIGVMIYGAADTETLGLNESTCWSGGPRTDNDNANGAAILPQLQAAMLPPLSGNVGTLWNQFHGNSTGFGTSRPFGILSLAFAGGGTTVTNYQRSLDLATGVASVSYALGGVNFTRQIFVSNPDQLAVMQLSADQPGKISFTAQFQTVANNGGTGAMQSAATNVLLFNGQPVTSGGQSVNSHGRLLALNSGGSVATGTDGLTVTNANSVTLLLALGTTLYGNNPTNQCLQQITSAAATAYAALLSRHTND
jgi:alpha-L-fucosidase 2